MPARWSSRRSFAIGSRRRARSRRSRRCAIRRAGQATPLLSPTSPLPVVSFGPNASLRDILNFIGTATGINVTYDSQYQDKAYTVRLEDVTLEQALQQIMTANQLFYKVLNPKTIIVIPDNAQKHAQYDDLVVRVFYISHADVSELAQVINTIMRIPTMPVQPTLLPNKTANTITVRAHGAGRGGHRADHPGQRQAAGRGRHRRADPRGQPETDEGARAEPEQLLARPDVLAGGRAAEHVRDDTAGRRRRRST